MVFATGTGTDLPANEGRNKRPEAKGNIFYAVMKAEEDVLVPASLVLVCWYLYGMVRTFISSLAVPRLRRDHLLQYGTKSVRNLSKRNKIQSKNSSCVRGTYCVEE